MQHGDLLPGSPSASARCLMLWTASGRRIYCGLFSRIRSLTAADLFISCLLLPRFTQGSIPGPHVAVAVHWLKCKRKVEEFQVRLDSKIAYLAFSFLKNFHVFLKRWAGVWREILIQLNLWSILWEKKSSSVIVAHLVVLFARTLFMFMLVSSFRAWQSFPRTKIFVPSYHFISVILTSRIF